MIRVITFTFNVYLYFVNSLYQYMFLFLFFGFLVGRDYMVITSVHVFLCKRIKFKRFFSFLFLNLFYHKMHIIVVNLYFILIN